MESKEIFEQLIRYFPDTANEYICSNIREFSEVCLSTGDFESAVKYADILLSQDCSETQRISAYRTKLFAKLKCRSTEEFCHCKDFKRDMPEYEELILASSSDGDKLKLFDELAKENEQTVAADEERRRIAEEKRRRAEEEAERRRIAAEEAERARRLAEEKEQERQRKLEEEQRQRAEKEAEQRRMAAKKRRRKIRLAASASACVVVAGAALGGWFTYYNSQNRLIYSLTDEGYAVSAGKFYKAEGLVIPDEYEGLAVVAVADNAFSGHGEIESVVLPERLISIGDGAFSGCANLSSVTVAEQRVRTAAEYYASGGELEYVGDGAFDGCIALEEFSFEYGLEHIGDRAFAGAAFTQVSLPATVEYVGGEAFSGCERLNSIIVGDRDEMPMSWAENWRDGCNASVEFRLRVVFDYNGATDGGYIAESYVFYNGEFDFIVPERKGYAFDGWFRGETRLTDAKGASLSAWQFNDGGIITAHWTPNINSVVFNANGGEGEMPEQKIATDESAQLSANMFTRRGYTFAGWATSVDGSAIYADQSQYIMGTKSSYELYAVWEANRYNVVLNAEGGVPETNNAQVAFDSYYSLPVPESEGYKFLGWYDGTEQTATAYTDDNGYSLAAWSATEDKMLYAHWQRIRFSITLNYEGAEGNADTQFVYVWTGSEYTLPVPERSNHTFGGWYSEADGKGTLIADWQGIGVGEWSGESDISAYALWYESTEGLIFESNEDGGYTLTAISNAAVENVVIPPYYKGKPVTKISQTALQNYYNLRSLTIFSTVTEIAGGALSGCSSLESITLPFVGAQKDGTSNTHFGYIFGASSYSQNTDYVPASLKEVIITGGESIDRCAFSGCSSLTSIIIRDSVSAISIGFSAFADCGSLESITIPDSVTRINDYAFQRCSSLTSITIPDSIVSIGNDVFSNCSSLTIYCEAASKPSGWNSYWNSSNRPVVWDCKNNDTADDGYIYAVIDGVRYSLKDNNAAVIRQPSNLSGKIVIPYAVKYNGDIYIVTNICDSAFLYCNNLTSITLPFVGAQKDGTSNTHFGYIFGAPSYSENADYVPESLKEVIITGGESMDDYAFYGCSSLTSITISDSVISIGDGAFSGCISLTSINIGNGVTRIGGLAFLYCSSLEGVYITDIAAWCAINFNGSVANPLYYAHNLYFNGKQVTDLVIPEGVTSIGSIAFALCSLESVIIPDSVTSIGYSAFDGCSSLTSVTLGNGVTSIGSSAFEGCDKIIQIENGVSYVGKWAIDCDTLVKSVELRSDTVGIADSAFSSCGNLKSIIIPDSVISIGREAFYNCRSLSSITIPDSVTSIASSAFQYCTNLTIYCEAESRPSGWHSDWNSSNCPVIWGYKGD